MEDVVFGGGIIEGEASILSLRFFRTFHTMTMFINTVTTMDSTANPTFSHDIVFIAFIVFLAGSTHKLYIFNIGHFYSSTILNGSPF
jgi:hypothetical protein